MAKRLQGRVAIITGAGRGLGREHALLLAREGARVVVNDLGIHVDGTDGQRSPAGDVVAEIEAAGGEAVADGQDVSTWDGGQALVDHALETFGRVDVLVNNAGILRDRTLASLTEREWEDVIRVHLKGHASPAHHVAAHWREEARAGRVSPRAIVNTSSGAGLFGNAGQTNYAAAKAGIAAMTQVWAKELARYEVRVNAIAPVGRTRMSGASPALNEQLERHLTGSFDGYDPANVSPVVAYLCSDDCAFNGFVFHVMGGHVALMRGWGAAAHVRREGRWTADELATALQPHADEAPVGDWDEILASFGMAAA